MGGLTVLYALTTADRFTEEERGKMPPVHGAFAMCPLLDGEFAYVQRLT
jgi:hypothetical protein